MSDSLNMKYTPTDLPRAIGSHPPRDVVAEMNRHLERLVEMKAPEILLQCATNDRRALFQRNYDVWMPPTQWDAPLQQRKWWHTL